MTNQCPKSHLIDPSIISIHSFTGLKVITHTLLTLLGGSSEETSSGVRSNSFLESPYTSVFSINSSFTIMILLKPIQVQSRWVRVFGRGSSLLKGDGLWVKAISNSTSMFQMQTSSGENVTISHEWVFPSLNKWTHIAGTWNTSHVSLLANGTFINSRTASNPPLSDNENLTIGWARNFPSTVAPMPQAYYDGAVLFNRSLT